jgi:hypothetical protein
VFVQNASRLPIQDAGNTHGDHGLSLKKGSGTPRRIECWGWALETQLTPIHLTIAAGTANHGQGIERFDGFDI